MDALKKAENELNREMDRATTLIYPSICIALNRLYGFGKKRLYKVLNTTLDVWQEVGSTNKVSMVQLVEEETGIELQNGDGKSWNDLIFLNDKRWNHQRPNRAMMILVRQQQKKWVEASVIGGFLIALHRCEGFGQDRIKSLINEVHNVKVEYDYDEKALYDICYQLTKVNLVKDRSGNIGIKEE